MAWQYEGVERTDHLDYRHSNGVHYWSNYDNERGVIQKAELPVDEVGVNWTPGNNPPASANIFYDANKSGC